MFRSQRLHPLLILLSDSLPETSQDMGSKSRLVVPAQTVDATPCSALLRQCFPE